MDSLPFDILDEILFKLDLKSVWMMQCTDRSIKSHITKDQFFKSYLSRTGSKLFHISTFGSNIIFWHSTDPKSTRNQQLLQLLQHSVIGSCSGLHLHFVDRRLCVSDPFTKPKKPLSLDHYESKFLSDIISPRAKSFRDQKNRIGFAVDKNDQKVKIVCINEVKESNPEETMYQFEIITGDSTWRLSETTITCRSSDLIPVNKPVYFDGYVHWLRNDGSILAFNPGTEKARLIPTKLPQQKQISKNISIMLAAADNKLTLVMAMEEVIYVYALDNIITNHPKWDLVNRIDNGESIKDWDVAAYDGESLMVREKEEERYNGVVHVFDFTPHKKHFTSQSKIVRIIVGISSLNVMSYFYDKKITGRRKRLIREEEKPSRSPYVQRFNKRIRSLLVNE